MIRSTLQSIINFFLRIYDWFKKLFKRETIEKTSKKADLKSILIKKAETMDPLDFNRSDKGSQSESISTYDLPVYEGHGSDFSPRTNEYDQEAIETEETVLEIVEEPIETEVDSIDESVEESLDDAVESSGEIVDELVEESEEEFVDEPEDEEVDDEDYDHKFVEVEVTHVHHEPMRSDSTETEDFTIPIVEALAQEMKPTNSKLKWEPVPSVPKYAITINSKLQGDDILHPKITTKGKAAALAQAKMDRNQSRAKDGKDQFRKELEEKRAANALARAKIVEAERARVAAAKLKREELAEKLKREAAERFQKEKELKLKERSEYEEKKQEINRARVEAIKSSKVAI